MLSPSHISSPGLKVGGRMAGALQRLVKETLEREKLNVHKLQGVRVRTAQLHKVVGLFGKP